LQLLGDGLQSLGDGLQLLGDGLQSLGDGLQSLGDGLFLLGGRLVRYFYTFKTFCHQNIFFKPMPGFNIYLMHTQSYPLASPASQAQTKAYQYVCLPRRSGIPID
jgi:hypothetical protein